MSSTPLKMSGPPHRYRRSRTSTYTPSTSNRTIAFLVAAALVLAQLLPALVADFGSFPPSTSTAAAAPLHPRLSPFAASLIDQSDFNDPAAAEDAVVLHRRGKGGTKKGTERQPTGKQQRAAERFKTAGKAAVAANRLAKANAKPVRGLPNEKAKIHATSGTVYTPADAEAAIRQAHQSAGAVNPSNNHYPHQFHNRPNAADGKPAFPNEKVDGKDGVYDHTPERAGADRVVYKDSKKGPKFVGVMSHDGPSDFTQATVRE
ncbi:hypothetical protein DFJ73DRAFT_948000 [Zopfochytrium polystomum]|nr:hypothetical protein DFJ73DRAFT_948000 [Zopfochytrium polystomum]